MPRHDTLDDGIREIVLLLRKAGYKTFTSCEGGKGHAFPEPTVGLKFRGDYFQFRDRLVAFLQSQGRRFFEVTLVSSYHPKYPQGKHYVYLVGYDIASAEKRKKIGRSIRQRERRLSQVGARGAGRMAQRVESKTPPSLGESIARIPWTVGPAMILTVAEDMYTAPDQGGTLAY